MTWMPGMPEIIKARIVTEGSLQSGQDRVVHCLSHP